MERGRVDHEDLIRLYHGRLLVNALLDHADVLTDRQREVVQLYYREHLPQADIAMRLGVTQQAVADSLLRARRAVSKHVREVGGEIVGGLDRPGDEDEADAV